MRPSTPQPNRVFAIVNPGVLISSLFASTHRSTGLDLSFSDDILTTDSGVCESQNWWVWQHQCHARSLVPTNYE